MLSCPQWESPRRTTHGGVNTKGTFALRPPEWRDMEQGGDALGELQEKATMGWLSPATWAVAHAGVLEVLQMFFFGFISEL